MQHYDNYDYEKEYNKQISNLEEWEYERLLKDGRIEGIYRTNTIKSKNVKEDKTLLESVIYPSFSHRSDVPRKKKSNESKASKIASNNKRARRKLMRLININFGKGDLWCTFGWGKEHYPENEARAKKDVQNFIRYINRRRKKAGKENIKYIYVLAYCEYERPHVHMILEGDMNRDEIESLWTKSERKNTRRIQPDDNGMIIGLTEYISRNPHGTKRWCCSRNLKRPSEPTRSYTKFKKRTVEKMAKNYEVLKDEMEKKYPGYKFIDAEVKYNGITAAFYIYARMVRN